MEDYYTRLKLLPVCSCGYIFTDGVVIRKDINTVEYKGVKDIMKYPSYSIEPNICPNCKRVIECVEYYDHTIG